jgi:hypothetical protein
MKFGILPVCIEIKISSLKEPGKLKHTPNFMGKKLLGQFLKKNPLQVPSLTKRNEKTPNFIR